MNKMVKIKEAEYKKVSDLTEEQKYFYKEGRNDPTIAYSVQLLVIGIVFGMMIADLLHRYYPSFFE